MQSNHRGKDKIKYKDYDYQKALREAGKMIEDYYAGVSDKSAEAYRILEHQTAELVPYFRSKYGFSVDWQEVAVRVCATVFDYVRRGKKKADDVTTGLLITLIKRRVHEMAAENLGITREDYRIAGLIKQASVAHDIPMTDDNAYIFSRLIGATIGRVLACIVYARTDVVSVGTIRGRGDEE